MTDIEELKRLAEAHLSNFHADSMPPMKIEAQTVPLQGKDAGA